MKTIAQPTHLAIVRWSSHSGPMQFRFVETYTPWMFIAPYNLFAVRFNGSKPVAFGNN